VAGRTSFAFDGVGGKWLWLERDGAKVPIDEMKAEGKSIESSQGIQAVRDFQALIKVKVERAARGELVEPEDGRPYLVRQPA
jgi:hypothetical protein